jgi:pyruvate,water dikinase
MKDIMWFQECCKTDIDSVGGKNANLGEMIRAGIHVPPGFAVTVNAYKKVIPAIQKDLDALLSQLRSDDNDALEKASGDIRALIERISMPDDVEKAIDEFYDSLASERGADDFPVAVRSSATAEDLPDASFAGQQDTFLWITGKENVKRSVVKCWSSLFTPRTITYRIKKNIAHDKVLISVGVQKMVNSRVAGVNFTLNPITGDRTKIVISGSWGLGESVVSGQVTPDEFIVDKITHEIVSHRIAQKLVQHVVSPETGSVEETEVPPDMQEVSCLTDEEVLELTKLSEELERHYGYALDIEWAIDRDLIFPDNIFIVQARPETVWTNKARAAVVQKETGTTDYILDVLKGGVKLFK